MQWRPKERRLSETIPLLAALTSQEYLQRRKFKGSNLRAASVESSLVDLRGQTIGREDAFAGVMPTRSRGSASFRFRPTNRDWRPAGRESHSGPHLKPKFQKDDHDLRLFWRQ